MKSGARIPSLIMQMTKEQFINYHTVSFSQKQKEEGIGFVGVGAKIYSASRDGSEILIVTGTGTNNILASKMYWIGKRIEYDSSVTDHAMVDANGNMLPHAQINNGCIESGPF
jgi:hypothetical protein